MLPDQSIRAHNKEWMWEFFRLPSISIPISIQGTKVNDSLVMDPEGLSQNSLYCFILICPHPTLSTQILIFFYPCYMRIWVNNYSCLWESLGVIITGYTCHGVTGSFLVRTQHLPLFSGFWIWELAQFWKLAKLEHLPSTCISSILVFFCFIDWQTPLLADHLFYSREHYNLVTISIAHFRSGFLVPLGSCPLLY